MSINVLLFHIEELLLAFPVGLLVINSLSFCLPRETFVSPTFLKGSFSSKVFLVGRIFLSILIISSYSFLICKGSVKKCIHSLMYILLYVLSPLAAFKIIFNFWQFHYNVSWCCLFYLFIYFSLKFFVDFGALETGWPNLFQDFGRFLPFLKK